MPKTPNNNPSRTSLINYQKEGCSLYNVDSQLYKEYESHVKQLFIGIFIDY